MKVVRLTWRGEDGETHIDDVLLVEEDDAIYAMTPNDIAVPTFNLFDKFAQDNRVVFEDEDGIFTLASEDVISVEVL